ncbi:guanine deaminase [Georgenia ruanii]|uniref:Guanine deaminase n=1 Tax=Georgenia ruanii TaxID=348442 RepID=A0A7J9V2Z9_9MICO|nr:guanine deaminase [Georgenia ruanii]MPV90324.1 guanine deaminase [Georgenia ruanii]
MTLYRAAVMDTPRDPLVEGPDALRADADAGLLVRDGVVAARGPFAAVAAAHPEEEVVDLRAGVLLPGFVDTHVHYPQVRIIGGLGMPLLDWLTSCALPEEARLADAAHARAVAREFVDGLVRAGTTTALVFGSHFPGATDAVFAAAEAVGLRMTAGLVVGDRFLPEPLLTTPDAALAHGRALLEKWHGRGRLRYAVTPRFSLSTSDAMLEACAELLAAREDVWFTSHLNENPTEIEEVRRLFPGAGHYLDSYHQHGLVTARSVLAHNVHPTAHELEVLAGTGAAVAHCPTSNCSLGSGLFPLAAHLDAGVRVALGSDVGAGSGFCLLKEGLQAYFVQRLLGPHGVDLGPAALLHLATRAGALALGLSDQVGDLAVGKQFDAVWVRPQPGTTLDVVLRHGADAPDALAKIFTLGTPSDIAVVWVAGRTVSGPSAPVPPPLPLEAA